MTMPTEAVDEEGNETEELKYVPLLPGEKVLDEEGNPVVDEEGNETGEEKPAEFEVLAPEPIPEEVRKSFAQGQRLCLSVAELVPLPAVSDAVERGRRRKCCALRACVPKEKNKCEIYLP